MKKLFILGLLVGGAFLAWRKLSGSGGARDLWAEVTDTFE